VATSTDPISFSGPPARANPVWIVGAAVFVALLLGGVLALHSGSATADARGWFFMGVASAVWASAHGPRVGRDRRRTEVGAA
jgi:hypothetical protein